MLVWLTALSVWSSFIFLSLEFQVRLPGTGYYGLGSGSCIELEVNKEGRTYCELNKESLKFRNILILLL